MHKVLGKFSDQIYAIMRIVVGYTFLWHGAQKLFGALGANQVELASRMGIAGFVEFFGGLLILIGLFASWAAFISSGEMAVAYFMAHASQGSPHLPIVNHGELAVVYCFVFLYIASRGAGKWSLASALGKDSLA